MKIKYLIIVMMLLIPFQVLAAPNASISSNLNSVERGKAVTVTVTLTDTAAWNIKITGSGAATCSTKQADVTSDGKSITKKFDLSCTSTTEGTINFTVVGDITSGSGETKDINISKQVTVTKPKSGVNTLSDLKIDNTTLSGFSSSKISYSINTSNASINIAATATDPKANINGVGLRNLNYGKNTINVVVTAENGSKNTYTIIVNRADPRSTNNNLKSLSIDSGKIDFNKDVTNYTFTLEHNINEINIKAIAEDSKASISGIGKKTLNDYLNEFQIIVKAENESTKTYTIRVIRKDKDGNVGKLSEDNSVKLFEISNYNINFDNNVKKYNILLDENVETLDIKVEPNDPNARVNIIKKDTLKSGLNEIVVQVIAENNSINEFKINAYKIGEISNTPVEKDEGDEKTKTKGINIWLIISMIEFMVIIILIILLKSKKKEPNKPDGYNKDKQSLNNSVVDNQIKPVSIINNGVNINNEVEIQPKMIIDFEE